MVQASVVALAAALLGIALQYTGINTPAVSIIGTACIMGAFIIAVTAFLLFCRDRFFATRGDELVWKGGP